MIDCLIVPYGADYSVKTIEPVPDYNMGIVKFDTNDIFGSLDNVNISIFDLDDYKSMKFNQIIGPLREHIRQEKPRLILGMDYGLSYSSISALDPDNVVHVDFHHDTYEDPPIEFLAYSNWAKKLLEEGHASKWLWLHTSDYPNVSDNPFHISTYGRVIDFVKFYNNEFNNRKDDDIPSDMIGYALNNLISGQNWLGCGNFYLSICTDGVYDFKDFSNDYRQRLSDFSFDSLKRLLMLGPGCVDLMEFKNSFLKPESTSRFLSYLQEIIDLLDAHPPISKPLLKLQQNI
ncbi:hypothetical protein GQ472_00840 [archaeon]|nr:hypothetical protein [archaeon]